MRSHHMLSFRPSYAWFLSMITYYTRVSLGVPLTAFGVKAGYRTEQILDSPRPTFLSLASYDFKYYFLHTGKV